MLVLFLCGFHNLSRGFSSIHTESYALDKILLKRELKQYFVDKPQPLLFRYKAIENCLKKFNLDNVLVTTPHNHQGFERRFLAFLMMDTLKETDHWER